MITRVGNFFLSILFKMESRLVLLSFLMLFTELTLIRWSGSTIYYIFFFSNFVLLASFLGISIGFLRSPSRFNLFPLAPFFLAALIYACYLYSYGYKAHLDFNTGNLDYHARYFSNNAFPVLLSLPIIFIAITVVMASIANGVATTFRQFPALKAYRLEVLGSLAGIIFFSLLSFLHARPFWWGIIICLLFISLLTKKNKLLFALQLCAMASMVITFATESNLPSHFWSAYYKIELQPFSDNRFVVNVNGLPQQIIETVKQRREIKPFYFLPYQHQKNAELNNVLIIGAGTGGDVAIALAQGARHIDAVEIDPMLYRLGKRFNPDHPYFDPRVTVHINDGRAFLQQSVTQYDMIIFALTDSLMLIPGQSSLRLENYLYTMESISRVKQLLKPDGMFTIYNYYRAPWLIDRLANTLTEVFNHPPCLDTSEEKDYWATVLSISPQANNLHCKMLWRAPLDNIQATEPSTDNHPFLYLMDNTFPLLYSVTLGFIVIISFIAIRLTKGSLQSLKSYPDLLLMGTAFLLLETKSIINFALLFGTTWFVNALVFIGILLTIYFAIELASRCKSLSLTWLFSLLLVALFLSWLIPPSYLLSLPYFLRFIVATLLAFGAIFLANLIFSERFRQASDPASAFGANLVGAMLGGLLEYCSITLGYRALFILIALLYTVAVIIMLRLKKPIYSNN